MNFEAWQAQQKALKEADRRKKTQAAEALRTYKSDALVDEATKLSALKEQERKQKLEAERQLREYRSQLSEVDSRKAALKEEERRKKKEAEEQLRGYGIVGSPTSPTSTSITEKGTIGKKNGSPFQGIERGSVSTMTAMFDNNNEKQMTVNGHQSGAMVINENSQTNFNIPPPFPVEKGDSPSAESESFPNISAAAEISEEKKTELPFVNGHSQSPLMEENCVPLENGDIFPADNHPQVPIEDISERGKILFANGPLQTTTMPEKDGVLLENVDMPAESGAMPMNSLSVEIPENADEALMDGNPPPNRTMEHNGVALGNWDTPTETEALQSNGVTIGLDTPDKAEIAFVFGLISSKVNPSMDGYLVEIERIVSSCLGEHVKLTMGFEYPYVKSIERDEMFRDPAGRLDVKKQFVTISIPFVASNNNAHEDARMRIIESVRLEIERGTFKKQF